MVPPFSSSLPLSEPSAASAPPPIEAEVHTGGAGDKGGGGGGGGEVGVANRVGRPIRKMARD